MSQRTLAKTMGELFELQSEQIEAALKLCHKRQMLQSWTDGMERSKHDRDFHNRYWDHNGALQFQRQYEAEAREAQEQFGANQAQLKELKDEVVTLMTTPH